MREMVAPRKHFCDICGSESTEQLLICSREKEGCPAARHLLCFDDSIIAKLNADTIFLCLHCTDHPDSNATSVSREGKTGSMKDVAARGTQQAPDASGTGTSSEAKAETAAKARGGGNGNAAFAFAAKDGPQNGSSERSKGQKRPNTSTALGHRPASKARLEAPQPAAPPPINLLDQVMKGQQQERERQELQRKKLAVRQEQQQQLMAGGGGASESKSEQRLKRKPRNPLRELTPEMEERQRRLVAASIKEKVIWSGRLEVQLPEKKDNLVVEVQAYCMAGNAHAMDALLKMPKDVLKGAVVDSREVLEMTAAEASEYACLVFKGSDPDNDRTLTTAISSHLSNTKLLQMEVGENKPLWLGLLAGPSASGCCLGVFVRYEDCWRHSDKTPGKGLLKKERRGHKRKLEWPDHQRVDRKSADLERKDGPGYGHLRLDRTQAEPHGRGSSPTDVLPSSLEEELFKLCPPKPLSDLRAALVGFDRKNSDIINLRNQLTQKGASTYLNPWPGCCQVIALPEQLINKDLGMEHGAPKEFEPIRDHLLAGTRVFLNIDYLRLCCELGRRPTREEEMRHNIKELWPEGAVFVGDAATIHAAATAPADRGTRTMLDELFRVLHAAAASGKVSGSVWQVVVAPRCLAELKGMASPAVHLVEKWRIANRFATIDPNMATSDLGLNASKLAQYFRFFCRYIVVLARPTDTDLLAAVEARNMVHAVTVDKALPFLRSQLSMA